MKQCRTENYVSDTEHRTSYWGKWDRLHGTGINYSSDSASILVLLPGQTTSIQFLHVFTELGNNGAVYRPSNLPVGNFG